jgi:uncharacterized protein YbjT (DUF2867 family)
LKVLVYGATGLQAGPTVGHLLRRGHTPHVLTRNADKAAKFHAAGVVPVVTDLADRDGLRAASKEVDSVAFLLPAFLDDPADALMFGRNAIDAAAEAGLEMFVWNASGEIGDEPGESNAKLSILSHLQESALPFVVFEPTTYMENWLGPWTAPSIRDNDELTYPVLADRKMGWIASDDVCALVVAALEQPRAAGKRYSISGIETPTGPELAAQFSAALARNICYRTMTPKEMGQVLDEAFGPGAGDNVAEMYRREQEDPAPADKFHDMSGALEALPVRMSTIREWVSKHKDAFI